MRTRSSLSPRRLFPSVGLAAALALGAASCGSDSANPGGSLVFTVSGEQLALGGYSFPPSSADDPAFVDGWEVKFTQVLVTVGKLTLSENPDLNPGDQSKTGPAIARVDGPWAIDLHKGGPLPGKGGSGEQAVQIATLDNQNLNDGKPFQSDTRYAFGYDVVAATSAATLVNLDAEGKANYALMQEKGYTVLYVGTATFKGTSCIPADAAFDKLPKVVSFKLGFAAPTTYINCQNPDNDPAEPLGAEESQRGVIVKANQAAVVQLTVHVDHPFWDSFVHDAAAHFDMIAAQYVGTTGTPTATLEDMKGVDPTAITAKDKSALPWRTCTPFYTPPAKGQLAFSPGGIPVNPAGTPATSLRDLYDFMTYSVSTQGHLNSDGLCAVKRNYPAPR